MSTTNKKVIREYPLPCTPETVVFELTGDWLVLRVEGRFAKPCLYILEDVRGRSERIRFFIVPTNTPVDAACVSAGNVHLGCYSVPGHMLHVFGRTTGSEDSTANQSATADRNGTADGKGATDDEDPR